MSVVFKDRDGNTPLSVEEKEGLRHKFIQTIGELDTLEQENIAEGLVWLKTHREKDIFNISFSNNLHKRLFGKVWRWAGKFRKSEKNIGIEPSKISVHLHNLFQDLLTWIEYSSYSNSEILARFHHQLVFIHPYPNGNGRWARVFTELLMKKLGMNILDWYAGEAPEKRRRDYIQALRSADEKSMQPLIEYFSKMKERVV